VRDPEIQSVAKWNQGFHFYAEGFAYGMRCQIGVNAASGLVHSVVSNAANVNELNIAEDRLHGEERLIYGNVDHIGIEKSEEFQDCDAKIRIVMCPASSPLAEDLKRSRLTAEQKPL
jgi:IS5 family transposase